MGKKHIDISIDEETLFLLNQQIRDGERSALFENLARNYLEGLDPEIFNVDEIKLIRKIETLEDQRDKLNVEISVNKTILKRLQDERIKQEDEEQKQRRFVQEKEADGMLKGGVLRDIAENMFDGAHHKFGRDEFLEDDLNG
jgi:hypothetical protein